MIPTVLLVWERYGYSTLNHHAQLHIVFTLRWSLNEMRPVTLNSNPPVSNSESTFKKYNNVKQHLPSTSHYWNISAVHADLEAINMSKTGNFYIYYIY